MTGKLGSRARSRAYQTRCHIDTAVMVTNADHFTAGTGCALYHGTYVLNDHGSLTLGEDSHLGAYCYVNALYGNVTVGSHVAIGPGTKLFAYSNHYAPGQLVSETKIQQDVQIGDNVFVGANSVILPGTVIEDDVVVGAGSVVKGRLTRGQVYAGAPARLIRDGW
jgi:acetyltransferase-like isoleucine patch superfamily enzyme